MHCECTFYAVPDLCTVQYSVHDFQKTILERTEHQTESIK